MNIGREPLSGCYTEVGELIRAYYADTNAQDGIPPLEMDWRFFLQLEESERLTLFTARTDCKVIGVAMYMVVPHPQHGGMPTAICNTLAVATKQRRKGIASKLVEAALEHFRTATDVKMITHGFRTIYDTEPLFPKLGFTLAEKTYIRIL